MSAPTVETSLPGSAPSATLGRTVPRLWTPPLRDLNRETSYGYAVVEFGEMIGLPLDPWERWGAIHLGELLPDGRPRFRQLLILVARQNGKTTLLVVLALYWLFVDRVPLVLGTSTKLDYAAESWRKACRLVRRHPALRAEVPAKGGIRRANGEQVLWRADMVERLIEDGSRYKIAASNEEGGRSLSPDRLIMDELRQHHDYSAWDASVPAMTAVPDAQAVGISNAGSHRSVVLNELRRTALAYITSGEGDPRLGLFEWSAPEDASPLDVDALAQANPNLGYRIDADALLADARKAVEVGGDKLAGFKTEHMCITVALMDPAVNMDRWRAPAADGGCYDPGDLDAVRDRVALVVELSIDGLHATLYAAAEVGDGRVRVDPVAAWSGADCSGQIRRDLPGLVDDVGPRVLGWFPAGPTAVLAADLGDTFRGVPVKKITSVPAVCMGFAGRVAAGGIAHAGDSLLNAHLEGTEKLVQGDGWRFVRRGVGHCDASYAAAGAVHLALNLPPKRRKARVVVARAAQPDAATPSAHDDNPSDNRTDV